MRDLVEVTVAPGPSGAYALRDAFATALAGGPAVAPVPASGDGYAARVRAALRPDLPLERADVVAVVATSGSTGAPRGVLLTERAVRAATAALEERLGGPGDWVLALPAHTVGGFMVLVRTVLAGTALHVDPSTGGALRFDPERFAATVAASRGARRRYVSLVPAQLQRLADAGRLDPLREFDAVLSGAAATPGDLRETLRAHGIAVLVSYGTSETCGGAAYDGLPQPGLTIRTDAPDGRSLGRLAVSGAAVAAGYRLAPDPALRDGTLVTSDLGRVGADGRVTVVGRADDVVVVAGTNVALPAVTAALRATPGVRDAYVVAVPDRVRGARLIAYLTGTPAPDDALRAAVRAELGAAAVPRAFVRLAQIPLLASGKPDRQALLAAAPASPS